MKHSEEPQPFWIDLIHTFHVWLPGTFKTCPQDYVITFTGGSTNFFKNVKCFVNQRYINMSLATKNDHHASVLNGNEHQLWHHHKATFTNSIPILFPTQSMMLNAKLHLYVLDEVIKANS